MFSLEILRNKIVHDKHGHGMSSARLEILLGIDTDHTGYHQVVIADGPKFAIDLLYNRDYTTSTQLFKTTRTPETQYSPAEIVLTVYTADMATEIMRAPHPDFLAEHVQLSRDLFYLCGLKESPDAALPFRELAEEHARARPEPFIPYFPDMIQGN